MFQTTAQYARIRPWAPWFPLVGEEGFEPPNPMTGAWATTRCL